MDRNDLIDRLSRQGDLFRVLLTALPDAEARWRPAPERWCPLEVVCHLRDEERHDFRTRLKHVLETPEAALPGSDPQRWALEGRYLEQDFTEVCSTFLNERERSVAWLRGLPDAPWGNVHLHPRVGPIGGPLLLANWVAHDLHHVRQLVNLRHAYLAAHCGAPLDYAGTW